MTDNEIIKALECCAKAKTLADCKAMKCPALLGEDGCFYPSSGCTRDRNIDKIALREMLGDAVDIINRQRAEIEKLQNKLDTVKKDLVETIPLIKGDIETAKAEAIKEFAERLKRRAFFLTPHPNGHWHTEGIKLNPEHIDDLVKEMKDEEGLG